MTYTCSGITGNSYFIIRLADLEILLMLMLNHRSIHHLCKNNKHRDLMYVLFVSISKIQRHSSQQSLKLLNNIVCTAQTQLQSKFQTYLRAVLLAFILHTNTFFSVTRVIVSKFCELFCILNSFRVLFLFCLYMICSFNLCDFAVV